MQLPLYATTVFVSAALLFWVQPLVAKILLPVLGGVPAVWNTCMVFFQLLLLAGYAYAHLLTTRASVRRQKFIHLALLVSAAFFLPLGFRESQIHALSTAGNPASNLLWELLRSVGVPFFVVATSGPLLQRWFSFSTHQRAPDPYFLYAASNGGSLLALLLFPVVLEPHLRLSQQTAGWSAGYVGLVLLVAGCAAVVRPQEIGPVPAGADPAAVAPLEMRVRLEWTLLAFAPSSLLLAVTQYLTTDIASIPLLWIVPLVIYLLTFSVAFSRSLNLVFLARTVSILGVAVIFLILARSTQPISLLILLHLVFFGLAALACHGRLAALRPDVSRLTEFYLYVALGGLLGGSFNALVAPAIFRTLIEYPLGIALACALVSPQFMQRNPQWLRDLAYAILIGGFTAAFALSLSMFDFKSASVRNFLVIGVPTVLCFAFADRPLRFSAALASMILGAWFYTHAQGTTLFLERNFFGISRVTREPSGRFHRLVHGNTVHGRQFVAADRRCEPLTYYHRTGPLGDVFTRLPGPRRVAVVGLGAGSMGCYSRPGQEWVFFEIDPAVIALATDTNCFTYLHHCTEARTRFVLGDARLRLQEVPAAQFDLLVIDAFSSDAIPVHLLTREAFAVYREKLHPAGILLLHISNRYLDLVPVIADLAADARLTAVMADDHSLTSDQINNGKEQSQWVALARSPALVGPLRQNTGWILLRADPKRAVWTDDFSNVFSAFQWK